MVRVKGVLVSCIPRFRYSAIYCMGSFLIMELARRRFIREISYLEEEMSLKVFSPKATFTVIVICIVVRYFMSILVLQSS